MKDRFGESRGVRRRTIGVWVALGGIVLVLGYALYYRSAWHTWFWNEPVRFGYCGRQYANPTRVRSNTVHGKLVPALRAPPIVGTQIYRPVDEGSCPGALYIKSTPGTYEEFEQLGGP